jgi:DNA-binding response OmpR family regulator
MNILIVEDVPIISDAFTLILKEGGHNSFQASDLNSALNEIQYR